MINYTLMDLITAGVVGFFCYPILKFFFFAVVEKAINDTDKQFDSLNINDDK